MSAPRRTYRVASADSATGEVDTTEDVPSSVVLTGDIHHFILEVAELAQDELRTLLNSYMSTDEDINDSKLLNLISAVARSEQIDVLKEKDEAGDTALHHAAAKGHTKTLQSLLGELSKQECFEVLSQRNIVGETTLHQAAANAKLTAINQILKSLDQPFELAKLQDNDGNTVLHYAVRNDNYALCKPILESLAQKEHYDIMLIRNNKGFNVVHEVTLLNNIDILRSILAALPQDHKAEVLAACDKDGNTVMHHAMNLKDTDFLTYIFDAIMQQQAFDLVGVQNTDGNTPLHLAAADRLKCVLEHLTLAQVFLTLSIQNMAGNTVTVVAAETGNIDVLDTALNKLVKRKRYKLLEIQNKRGYNALHSAVSKGQSKVIDCLASNLSGEYFHRLADARDSHNSTVLDLAPKEIHAKVLSAIINSERAAEEKIVKETKGSKKRKGSETGDAVESTAKLWKGLDEQLTKSREQLAQQAHTFQTVQRELHELRSALSVEKVPVTFTTVADVPEDSLTHPTMEQRDQTPAEVQMPDETAQTSGRTLGSLGSIPAPTIASVALPSSQNQTSVVRLGGQSNPATEMPTSTIEHANIIDEIGRILNRVEAGHSIMILDPDDYHKIYILGVDVQQGQVEFQALTSQEEFQSFTIIPHNLVAVHNGLPQYIKQFMPFNLEKAEEAGGESEYSRDHAKCQLIVHERQANSRQGDKYYGVTVAHAFLSHDQRRDLWDQDHAAILAVEAEIARNRRINWRLIGPHCRKPDEYIPMTCSPLIRYRLYFDDGHKIQEDLAVFEISEPMMRRQLPRYPGPANDMKKLAVFTSGFNQQYTVKGVLPIRTLEDIALLAGKRVLIAFAEGRVTMPPTPLLSCSVGNNMKLGLMLTFVTTSPYSLEPGHSGYMVYLVHRDDRHVYIAGMLTGKINCPKLTKVIYTAALVGAGLEMHSTLNLEPLINELQGRTVQTLRDDLQGQANLGPGTVLV